MSRLSAPAGGSSDQTVLVYIKRKHGTVLLHGGHQYYVRRAHKSGLNVWCCINSKKLKCGGVIRIRVSPEMIFESLCVLNLWKQDVQTVLILEYIKRNYPVNNVENELIVELSEKLRIAALVGIVTQTSEDSWALAGELEQRKLTANHVTLFWKAYADTLSPICRREVNLQKERSELPSDKRKGAEFGGDFV